MGECHESWGRYPHTKQKANRIGWRDEKIKPDTQYLPRGNGRSYGDSCLSNHGILLDTRNLDRLIEFDESSEILRCESGVMIFDVLKYLLPKGYCLPVVPGTQFVTIGGAIANDVHGKNHESRGTFGNNITGFELRRSDGSTRFCSKTENKDWFLATIGGLGLTGLITWADIKVMPIVNEYLNVRTLPFKNIEELFHLLENSVKETEYKAAWIDCLSVGTSLGRGILSLAVHNKDHSSIKKRSYLEKFKKIIPDLSIPVIPPVSLLNTWTVKWFNTIYYNHSRKQQSIKKYTDFMFPLDAIDHWNYLYGKKGFVQYQCVVPYDNAEQVLHSLLELVAKSRISSCLTVLKLFGEMRPSGLLSFPRPGVTLAMDFPIVGNKTQPLLESLDSIVISSGGAVYPAKDARMSATAFKKYYPNWQEMKKYMDPNVSSAFWERVSN